MAGSEAGDRVPLPRSLTLVIGLVVSATVAAALVLGPIDPWTPDIGLFAGGADLHVYRDGGWRVQHDLPLYGGPVVLGLLYTYTPFSALAFVPLERIPGAYVDNLWMALNLFVLAACIVLCCRILGYRITPYLLLVTALGTLTCTFLEPVRTTLFYGQINLVLMLLVLWDFSRPNSSRLRGMGTGIGAGIKLTPAYFVLVFLALRQWRTAAVAISAFLATVGVAWAVIPGDSRQYWTGTFFDSTRIADNRHPSNQSLRGTLARLTDGQAPLWVWFVLAATVTVVSILVSVRLYERGEHLLAVALSGLTMAVVSPYSWSHHWVWLIPLLVWLVHRALTVSRLWWCAVAGLFAATAAWPYWWSTDFIVIGLFLYPPSWPVAPVLQNIYLVVYVPVLVASAVFAGRTRPPALATVPSEPVDPVLEDPPHLPLRSA